MKTRSLKENQVEEIALAWLESLRYKIIFGPEIAPGELRAERADYHICILPSRLRDALNTLNPKIPADAIEEAFLKVTTPSSPSLITNNRIFHRMLTEGVEVEYQRPDGSITGDRYGSWILKTLTITIGLR